MDGRECRRDSSTAVAASPCTAIARSVRGSWGVVSLMDLGEGQTGKGLEGYCYNRHLEKKQGH